MFEVTDPGRLDTGDPVERLDEGGRGLELVSMVMDEVKLVRREGGGSLRFSKRFAAACDPAPVEERAPAPALYRRRCGRSRCCRTAAAAAGAPGVSSLRGPIL